jgi:tyrosinase
MEYSTPPMEMIRDGTVQVMPARGVKFLKDWTQSLASFDPELLPTLTTLAMTDAPLHAAALPKVASLSLPCQRLTLKGAGASVDGIQRCPRFRVRYKHASQFTALASSVAPQSPTAAKDAFEITWEDTILPLIKTPYWIAESRRAEAGESWIRAMESYGHWKLDKYEDVMAKATQIYTHLRSKMMPITRHSDDYWPEEALEKFRVWANSGFPRHSSHQVKPRIVIPASKGPEITFRQRRDIMSLSKDELAVYQTKLDDVLNVGSLGSKWQELGRIRKYLMP